jgi:hypothetical protein
MWVLVALLLLGGGGAGVYFATRGPARPASAPGEPAEPRDPPPDPREPPPRDPWAGEPGASGGRPRPAPEDGSAARDLDPTAADDGEGDPGDRSEVAVAPGAVTDVAQGVRLVVPPGFATQRRDGNLIAGDLSRLAIIAGPITHAAADPDALARAYAKDTGLQQMGQQVQEIAGAQRRLYMFAGAINRVPVMHLAVPLLGPGYRVAVIVHINGAAAEADPTLLVTASEILARRVLVPGS